MSSKNIYINKLNSLSTDQLYALSILPLSGYFDKLEFLTYLASLQSTVIISLSDISSVSIKDINIELEKYVKLNRAESSDHDPIIFYNKPRNKTRKQSTKVSTLTNKPRSGSWKTFSFPSGRNVSVQGYEHYALKYLLDVEHINENDITVSAECRKRFEYKCPEGISHHYYPDIFIPKDNLVIEVKSTWTWTMNKEINTLKKWAVKENGYRYRLMVFDNDGTYLGNECLFEPNISHIDCGSHGEILISS